MGGQGAGNRGHYTKRFGIGRTVWRKRATKNFDGRRFGERIAGNGFRRHGESELNAITGLMRSEIGNGHGDRRSRWSGLAGSAASGREQEQKKRRAKAETRVAARFELHGSVRRR